MSIVALVTLSQFLNQIMGGSVQSFDFFCKFDTVMFALVDRMTCVSIDKDFSMWSRADGAEMVVNLDDTHSALICSPSDGRTYTVLHPYALRCAVAD